ncbi:MAG: hypothetical protein ACM3O8_15465 [Methylococcaceae bacterium]
MARAAGFLFLTRQINLTAKDTALNNIARSIKALSFAVLFKDLTE